MDNKNNDKTLIKLCGLLYDAHTKIASIKAKYQTHRNLKEYERAQQARNISVFQIRNFPGLLGPLLDPIHEYHESTVFWQRPYLFKKEDIEVKRGGLFSKPFNFKYTIQVDKDKVIEDGTHINNTEIKQTVEIEKQLGLNRKEKMSAIAIEETYSNYLALQELFINPVRFLVDYDLDFIKGVRFLNRQALHARAKIKSPAIRISDSNYMNIFGDYSVILIDLQSGILLKREVYFRKRVIESFTLTEVEVISIDNSKVIVVDQETAP